MINCPKCQAPNPNNATVCSVCGHALAGEQFAQALGQAQQPQSANEQQAADLSARSARPPSYALEPAAAPEPAAPPQIQQPNPAQPTPQRQFDLGVSASPLGMGGGGQKEIDEFLAEQRASKRTRGIVYAAVGLILVIGVGFVWLQKQRAEKRKETVAQFYQAFRKIEDGAVADFWMCVVRAKDRDVRLASQATEVTEGLTKAFKNFPKSQPGRLLDKCIPMIPSIIDDLNKLELPPGFEQPLEGYVGILKQVKEAFDIYANKISQRKQLAIDEREIRESNAQFHNVIENSGGFASVAETPKAVGYYNILTCAVPGLVKAARSVTRPPDTQFVVEYIYNTCKKDPSFAEKLRDECFAARNSSSMRTANFKLVARRMAGDNRDLYAIEDCFKRANHGFAFEELKGVAEIFGKYRNKGRKQVMDAVQRVKQELSE